MLDRSVNRVDFDLSWWKEKEKNIDNTFQDISPGVKSSRAYRKARMEYFQSVYKRYRDQRHTLTKDEKLSMKLLRAAIKGQRRQLYPNWWIRNIVRLVKAVINLVTQTPGQWKDEVGHFDSIERSRSNNRSQLHEGLRKNGFESAIPELDQQMQKGLTEFQIPLAFYLDKDKSIEYRLQFKKGADGNYEFHRYDAHLQHENNPELNRSRSFRMVDNQGINAGEARNLLEGRAVEKTVVDFEGHSTKTWVQLNFNERDTEGQFKLKRFPPEHGFDLEKSLSDMPFREMSNPVAQDELFTKLKSGNVATITYDDGYGTSTMYAWADPKDGEVKYLDANKQPITREQVLNQRQQPAQSASLTIETPSQQQNQSTKLNNRKPQVVKKRTAKVKRGQGLK